MQGKASKLPVVAAQADLERRDEDPARLSAALFRSSSLARRRQ
jgi:hypothetical protein